VGGVPLEVSFTAPLWLHGSDGGWHFVTLPGDVADDVREHAGSRSRGFGSVRVTAVVGGSRWQTSVFPETQTGSYVLPVKQEVRRANDLAAGDPVPVRLLVD
jgi:hypothetical protein